MRTTQRWMTSWSLILHGSRKVWRAISHLKDLSGVTKLSVFTPSKKEERFFFASDLYSDGSDSKTMSVPTTPASSPTPRTAGLRGINSAIPNLMFLSGLKIITCDIFDERMANMLPSDVEVVDNPDSYLPFRKSSAWSCTKIQSTSLFNALRS